MAAAAALILLGVPAAAEPPPPPGGHIPIYFGGANQGGYPPASEAVAEPVDGGAPPLREATSAPNPFRGATTIRFGLAQGQEARLRIFDLTGRQVRELMHRATEAGAQEMQWDGRDQERNPLASGIYFYQVTAGERSVTKKLVLLR
jgi:hypothetical protein